MKQWQLQEAKARFSELLRSASKDGPQEITVRGKPEAVVISASEFQRLKKRKPRFVEFMRSSPLKGVELDLTRDKSPMREVDL
ncbi:MAG TPA: type II toxin-antitoxin system Phd/YefM family antitoxin [Rhizobiales bacterium]|nr:type II toxin-antitoxin system Phd/YefM family antitoxin [Hyphomicrobiales bacterium]